MCRFNFDKKEDSYGMTEEKILFDSRCGLRIEKTDNKHIDYHFLPGTYNRAAAEWVIST